MNNILFLQVEIIIFFLSWISILYFILDKILKFYYYIKNIIAPENIKNQKLAINKINTESNQNILKEKDYKNKKITEEDKIILSDILKKVRINSFKWSFDIVKHLIIEWLTIDKYNKELNLELANIYEKEDNYKNALFIYNDLVKNYPWDSTILKKQAFASAMEEEFEKSFLIYENIFKKHKSDIEVIAMLSDLAYKMKKYRKTLKYINLFLDNNPRDLDKILIKWDCLEKIWSNEETLKFYKKMLVLHPYNIFLKKKINQLSR